MPRKTTNFNWTIPVASDLWNELTLGNPTIEAIDAQAFKNQNAGVQTASHTRLGTVHALVRDIKTAPVIRFVATENYHALDTFTVDGESVSARLPDGTALQEGCFKTGNNVLCIMGSGVLTFYLPNYKASTAKQLETPVNIGEASFNGSKSITFDQIMGTPQIVKDTLQYSGCEWHSGGYIKIGKLVIINLRVVVMSLGENQTLVGGFPMPLDDASTQHNYVSVNAFSLATGEIHEAILYGSGSNVPGKINVYGTLRPNQNVCLHAVYICKD